MPKLYLIRHAKAAEPGPEYPDDSLRPLVERGQKQARALAETLKELEIRFDKLFSSPYARAWQTAQALVQRAAGGVRELAALTGDDYNALLSGLGVDANEEQRIALVGHEPYLSELAALLLSGSAHGLQVNFKKAGMLVLSGPLQKGEMTLEAYLRPKHYRRRA